MGLVREFTGGYKFPLTGLVFGAATMVVLSMMFGLFEDQNKHGLTEKP